MKIITLVVAIVACTFVSCRENPVAVNDKMSIEVREPKEHYALYLLIKNTDTVKINQLISQDIALEKFDFVPRIKTRINGDWSIVELDHDMSPFMIFNFIGVFTEANYGIVTGVGINSKNKAKSFYSITGEKIYQQSRGEYFVGRMEDGTNFKYYIFSDDTLNFVFEPLDEQELSLNISAFLNSKGFDDRLLSE